MNIRDFDAAYDLHSINKWRNNRNLKSVEALELPMTGFIISGVCAGFLRRCEGGMTIFDSLVTNPLVTSETRHKALSQLVDYILQYAVDNELCPVLAITVDEGTLERAKSVGFKQLPHSILSFSKE